MLLWWRRQDSTGIDLGRDAASGSCDTACPAMADRAVEPTVTRIGAHVVLFRENRHCRKQPHR